MCVGEREGEEKFVLIRDIGGVITPHRIADEQQLQSGIYLYHAHHPGA